MFPEALLSQEYRVQKTAERAVDVLSEVVEVGRTYWVPLKIYAGNMLFTFSDTPGEWSVQWDQRFVGDVIVYARAKVISMQPRRDEYGRPSILVVVEKQERYDYAIQRRHDYGPLNPARLIPSKSRRGWEFRFIPYSDLHDDLVGTSILPEFVKTPRQVLAFWDQKVEVDCNIQIEVKPMKY